MRLPLPRRRDRSPVRQMEMFGLDFVVIASRHAPDCDCKNPDARQVVAYPAQDTRIVLHSDGTAQVIIDFDPGQDHTVGEGQTYRAALVNLVADAGWEPPGEP